MATKIVENFINLIRQDDQVKKEFEKRKNSFFSANTDHNDFASKVLIPYANELGINLTLEDLENYGSDNKHTLSDEDLDLISGGSALQKGLGISMAVMSIISVGTGIAATLPQGSTPFNSTVKAQNEESNKKDIDYSAYEQKIVELINTERTAKGLKPVTLNKQISKIANTRSQELQELFSHTRPDGSACSSLLKQAKIPYKAIGENIAMGQKTPEEAMTAWMNSEGHRQNILNGNYSSVSIGIYQDADGVCYWTQIFTG